MCDAQKAEREIKMDKRTGWKNNNVLFVPRAETIVEYLPQLKYDLESIQYRELMRRFPEESGDEGYQEEE